MKSIKELNAEFELKTTVDSDYTQEQLNVLKTAWNRVVDYYGFNGQLKGKATLPKLLEIFLVKLNLASIVVSNSLSEKAFEFSELKDVLFKKTLEIGQPAVVFSMHLPSDLEYLLAAHSPRRLIMGYSCNVISMNVLEALEKILQRKGAPKNGANNAWEFRGVHYFHEIGREQSDGSVTGVVHKDHPTMPGYCVSAGRFKISSTGKVVKFPTTSKFMRSEAEILGLAEYSRVLGRPMFV